MSTVEHDLDRVKMNQLAKYLGLLGQRSLRSKGIIRTHRHKYMHTQPTKAVRNKYDGVESGR